MDLKNLRIEKGYSLQQVADGTGLPKTSLFHWESGERQPAADVLPKLAEFYRISIDELLGYKAPHLPAVEEPEEVFEEIKGKDEAFGVDLWRLTSNRLTIEKSIKKDLLDVKKTFFKIGYKLHLISKYRLYNPLGYESIIDYAEDKFGFGKSTTYNFMQVYNRICARNNPAEIQEEYLPYNYSQLVEMSKENIWARDGLVDVIKPTDSTKQIHDYIALWNRSYSKHGLQPKGATVKEALAIAAEEKAAEEKAKALPQATVIQNDDVPPGQISIFDDEENERPFDEPQAEFPEETENDFGGQEFVQGGGIDYDEEDNPIECADGTETTLPKKAVFRLAVKEFCEQYDYTIELHGRKQGAWAFGSVLFDYLQEKGLFD